jgi:Protein of unknown function (DUF3467)
MALSPKNPLVGIIVPTKDVPTMYSNHVNPSLSFNDIRLYFSEVVPKELSAVTGPAPTRSVSSVEPRLCVVISPEFAKALAQTLLGAVDKYESLFGPLRPQPSQENIDKILDNPTDKTTS